VFYASGHAGLEASHQYTLLARKLGTNNLPQSSNRCHETTSIRRADQSGQLTGGDDRVGRPGTSRCLLLWSKPGFQHPKVSAPLKASKEHGAKIVTFNPITEKGLVSSVDPAKRSGDVDR